MLVELRLLRYFVAVADDGNVTRAAERLHIAQPSLSAAVKQLEGQLGVTLVERAGRGIALTPAGELLALRGRRLLEEAEAVVEEVRSRGSAPAARLRLGLSPTARYGVAPDLLAACAREAPAVMLYTSEDTTGALLRDVATGRLDLAVVFCAPRPLPDGVEVVELRAEPAIVHLRDDHPLAGREAVSLADLAGETILVASSRESSGFTDRVLAAFEAAGVAPQTAADPYPDLGLQAVREGVGVVVYARGAFPEAVPGSAFVPIEPVLPLPFELARRAGPASAAVEKVVEVARGV